MHLINWDRLGGVNNRMFGALIGMPFLRAFLPYCRPTPQVTTFKRILSTRSVERGGLY